MLIKLFWLYVEFILMNSTFIIYTNLDEKNTRPSDEAIKFWNMQDSNWISSEFIILKILFAAGSVYILISVSFFNEIFKL